MSKAIEYAKNGNITQLREEIQRNISAVNECNEVRVLSF